MKLRNTLLLLFICSVVFDSFAQSNYQTFQSKGFKVKCDCKLQVNSAFIQMVKQQGLKNVLGSYICAQNEGNSNTGVIVNINIYDESENYKNIQQSNYATFDKKYMDQYIGGLTYSGIKYKIITYQGVQAIEYTFNQMGLPTTAIVFLKNKKSYLLQVSTRSDLTTKFNALKSSFTLL